MMRTAGLFLLCFVPAALFAQPTPRPGKEPVVPKQRASGIDRAAPRPNNAAPRRNTQAPQNRPNDQQWYAQPPRTESRPSPSLSPQARYAQPTLPNRPAAKPSATTADEATTIRWYTLQEAVELSKSAGKRKLFIDVHTTWCGWCKKLDQTTFTDPAVVRYLNRHYYPVKFDAEQTGDIAFNGKTYGFKRNGSRGHHELAAEWLNNRLSYPTMVFLDENFNAIQPIPGYQDARKLECILAYFGTDSHKTTPWETFERKFKRQP